jgi:hypothetical protein
LRRGESAVEDERGRFQPQCGLDQFGKVAGEIFAGLGAEIDRVAPAGEQAAEAVPFRLILPLGAAGYRID